MNINSEFIYNKLVLFNCNNRYIKSYINNFQQQAAVSFKLKSEFIPGIYQSMIHILWII